MTSITAISGRGLTSGRGVRVVDSRAIHPHTFSDVDVILPWMNGFEKRYNPVEYEHDIVKCVCGFSCPDSEETREMVQCDQCGNWQHIPCLKIDKRDIPVDYFCHECLPERHAHLWNSKNKKIPATRGRPPKKLKVAHRSDSQTSESCPIASGSKRSRRLRRNTSSGSLQSTEDLELDDDLKVMKTVCRQSQPSPSREDSGLLRADMESVQRDSLAITEVSNRADSDAAKSQVHNSTTMRKENKISGSQPVQTAFPTACSFSATLGAAGPVKFQDWMRVDRKSLLEMTAIAQECVEKYKLDTQDFRPREQESLDHDPRPVSLARLDLEQRLPVLCQADYVGASDWLLHQSCLDLSNKLKQDPDVTQSSSRPSDVAVSSSGRQIPFKVTKLSRTVDPKRSA